MPWTELPKYADYGYVCLMSSRDTEGMRKMLQAFSVKHGMSFQSAPLDPEGAVIVVELVGHGARLFAVNFEAVPEFNLDIRSYGQDAGYKAFAASLSDDLVTELKRLPGVVTEWRVLPEGYETDLPPSTRARRGTPPS